MRMTITNRVSRAGAIGSALLATTLIAGCASYTKNMGPDAAASRAAVATLRTAAGADVGKVTVREGMDGLRVTIDATGMPPGNHGAHIHMTGRCDAPDFTTAGGHWNPTTAKHGSMNPAGPHSGDLPNLLIGADGRGTLGATIPDATMAGMLDTDGAAMVIHAGADDLMTDPSGNSGARIACGVLAAQ